MRIRDVASRFAILREARFRSLYLSRAVSYLGDDISPLALSFAVLAVTHSAAALGVVLAAETVPMLVLLLVGGVIGDRVSRKPLLVASGVVRGTSKGILAVLLALGVAGLPAMVVLAAVSGLAAAFSGPAADGVVPMVVDRERLVDANALFQMTVGAAMLVGPLIAALLVVTVGAWLAVGVDGLSFVLSAALMLRIPLPAASRAAMPTTFTHDLAAGWRAFRSQRWASIPVAQHCLFHVFVMAPTFTLGVVVAEERLGGAGAWGVILAAGGAGSMLGGALALWHRPARPLVAVALGTMAVAPQVALLAVPASTAAIAAAAVLSGTGIVYQMVVFNAVQQERVAGDLFARFNSYSMLASLAGVPIGYLLVGPLSAALGTSRTLWLAALVAVGSSLALLAVPEIRRFRWLPDENAGPGLVVTLPAVETPASWE